MGYLDPGLLGLLRRLIGWGIRRMRLLFQLGSIRLPMEYQYHDLHTPRLIEMQDR